LPGASVGVNFEEDAGRVVAGLALPPGGAAMSWLGSLSADQRGALHDALAGFYKMAGVGLVRDQADEALLAEPGPDKLLFDRVPVRWEDWVRSWEVDQAGKGRGPMLAEYVVLLPPAKS
jgi:hypothetical protein